MSDPVATLLAAVQAGQPVSSQTLADDVVLDATVPNWRFALRGAERVRDQFAHWYADPGEFENLSRTPIPGGELVEFILTWNEAGVPYAAHQVHVIEIADGRIAKDTVFCGGRWDAGLLAEMEEASHAVA
jgi:ketosteroid isomerase-like protein